MTEVTSTDIEPFGQMMSELADHSDTMSNEELDDAYRLLGQLKREVAGALATVEAEMLQRAQSDPFITKGVMNKASRKGKWRFDHQQIASRAMNLAKVDTKTGEMRERDDALRTLQDLFADLYLSPSVTAKVGGLKRIGLEKKDAASFEHTGYDLERIVLVDEASEEEE